MAKFLRDRYLKLCLATMHSLYDIGSVGGRKKVEGGYNTTGAALRSETASGFARNHGGVDNMVHNSITSGAFSKRSR